MQRIWNHINKGLLAATAAVVTAVVITGLWGDHRSCLRQKPIRKSYNQYIQDASQARFQSAAIEARKNPAQAKIDYTAAAKFLLRKVPTIDCSTLPAGK